MKNTMTTKLFSLSCENHPTLLTRIIQTFTRPGYALETLSQSRTDVSDIVLITLEVAIPAAQVDHMILRLKRIIGVLEVTISFGSVLNSAVFTLSDLMPSILNSLNRFQARAVEWQHGNLLIHQIGKEADIRQLYDEIDGPNLVAFSRSPLAISQPLNWEGYAANAVAEVQAVNIEI
jgi:acetolactate synthase small subunit